MFTGWRLCDDSHVTSTSESSVVTKDAYLLFYRRRGCKGLISGPSPLNVQSSERQCNMNDMILPPSKQKPESEIPNLPQDILQLCVRVHLNPTFVLTFEALYR